VINRAPVKAFADGVRTFVSSVKAFVNRFVDYLATASEI
jgi:hypothetical protein